MKNIYLIPESDDSGIYLNKIKQKVDCDVIYQRGLLTDICYHSSFNGNKQELFLDYGIKGKIFRMLIHLLSVLFGIPTMVLDKRSKRIMNVQLEEHLDIMANEEYIKKELARCTKDHIIIMNYDEKYPINSSDEYKVYLISNFDEEGFDIIYPERLDTFEFKVVPLTIVLIGGACVGKTTLENRLIDELGFMPYTILTTREERDNDLHTFHASKEDILNNPNVIYNFDTVEGTTYGYISPEGMAVVSFIGYKDAEDFLNNLENKMVIKLDASIDEIEKCYKERNYDEETIRKRLSIIEKDKGYGIFTIHRDLAFRYIQNQIGG